MKTECCRVFGWRSVLFGLFVACAPGFARAQLLQPSITSIRQEGTNVVITARAPAGVRRLTLECRERLGPGAWEPRAVARADGSGGAVTFRLPRSRQTELMRVRGDATEPLPASFYSGTNSFLGPPGSSGSPNSVTVFAGGPRGDSAVAPEPAREVVESDIWKIRGQTLYFFNQYRGLQIIDIANPDAAVVRGTLALPAAGEQMYLLESNHVVLLARDGCYYGSDESQVLVVADTNGDPSVVAKLTVAGFIQESRLVGSALYVASQTYRPVSGSTNTTWEWGTVVSSFDLANPAAPVSRGTLWYAGYGNVVSATDRYLFVSTLDPNDWRHSIVRLIDVSSANGTMAARGSVRAAGSIADKFKISLKDDVLTLISQTQSNNMLTTTLETFSIAQPASPGKLGTLGLGMSEQLHATRFDGDRVYVVTFHVQFRLDPLWIVDLSDPAHPAIKGQLEIPGWSTYLQPMGDRLLALGIETNRTTVSLFDVADASQPALLSRVALGSGWSWSEANNDEKAFGVFPGAGLIVVPFQSWSSNGYITQVQLVDFGTNALALRGSIIDHQFEPRRAAVRNDRILSISGREYLSTDFSDRDHPAVRGTLDLAWPVDRLFVHGDHLIEVTTSGSSSWWNWRWSSSDRPTLRVTAASDPNRVLASLTLGELPIVGVTQRGNYLYVAQGPAAFWPIYWLATTDGSAADDASGSPLHLTIVSLEHLPQLSVAGRAEAKTDALNSASDWQAVWPRPGVLVWVGGMNSSWWWRGGPIDVVPAGGIASSIIAPWPWFWPGNGGQMLAFDVSDASAPKFASEVNLGQGSNNWWNFSKAFTADGLVYLSHAASEFVPGLDSTWRIPAQTNVVVANGTFAPTTNVIDWGTWVQKTYLDVVDYADAQQPTVRKPVNIPGTLNGLSRGGALLYTVGTSWMTDWNAPSWAEYLSALAYDGVSAHLVDSLALPSTWPHPLLVVDENIFVGRAAEYSSSNSLPSYVETWTLSESGKFTKLGQSLVTSPANTLLNFPGLLAAQQSDNTVALFDLSTPASLRLVGTGKPAGCLWFDLNHADGESGRGLWIPLGAFGVARIPAGP